MKLFTYYLAMIPALVMAGNAPDAAPSDKYVFPEVAAGCMSHATNILIRDYEPGIVYTLRLESDNSIVSGPYPGNIGLYTGTLTETTTFNVLATNPETGLSTVMTEKPVVVVGTEPPLDLEAVAEYPSGPKGHATNIIVLDWQPGILYTLRRNDDNAVVAGPWTGDIGLYTGALYETTTFNVLAVNPTTKCERLLSATVTVTIGGKKNKEKGKDKDKTGKLFGHADKIKDLSGVVQVYPNPASGSFEVMVTNDYTGEVNLQIRRVSGELLVNETAQKSEETFQRQFDFTGLKGAYLVMVRFGAEGSNAVLYKRLIIRH